MRLYDLEPEHPHLGASTVLDFVNRMSVSAVRGLSRTELDVTVAVGRWQYGTGIQHPVLAAASQQR